MTIDDSNATWMDDSIAKPPRTGIAIAHKVTCTEATEGLVPQLPLQKASRAGPLHTRGVGVVTADHVTE